MIEIIHNSDDVKKRITPDELTYDTVKDMNKNIRMPKNIKQVGDVTTDKQIYIEDYAFTYINSLAYNNPNEEQAGVLLGELQKDGNTRNVFIKGVVKAKLSDDVSERGIYFNEQVWNGIYTDMEQYFPNLTVVGWFASLPRITSERMSHLKKVHLDNFAGSMKTLCLVDTLGKEENFFLYEGGEMTRQKGYVCFYERNYEMQEYMLERKVGRNNEESGHDRAVQSIRTIIKEKEEAKEQRKTASFMYKVSGFMVVVVLVIGINLINNYEKMRSFDDSLNTIISKISSIGVSDDASNVGGSSVVVDMLPGDVYPTKEAADETSGTVESSYDSEDTVSVTQDSTSISTSGTTSDTTSGMTGSTTGGMTGGTDVDSNSSTDIGANVSNVSGQAVYEYTVKSGDTLYGICKKYYGDLSNTAEVVKYNNLDNEDRLLVGQVIKLP